MADNFVGFEIATYVVTASIVLAGVLIGFGRGFGNKKLENFGKEEFFQAVVNSAIIGAFAAIISLINEVSSSINSGQMCGTDKLIISQLICIFQDLSDKIFLLVQEMMKLSNTIAYYQTLSLNFDILTIQPFANLSTVLNWFSVENIILQSVIIVININITLLNFIGQNALLLLFPLGLVFRTFFATRRIGAFLIGLTIGLYLFYPSFVFIFPSPADEIANTTANLSAINSRVYYSAVPIIDLNDNNALAAKLDVLSGRCFNSNSSACQNATQGLQRQDVDFVSDLGVAMQMISATTGKALVYLALAPLLSLLITAIFVKEITKIFGGEFAFDSGFKMV